MLKKTYLLWLFGLALLSPNLPAQTDCDNVTQIPTVECDALLALYDSTNGEGWTDNKKWLTNNKPCGWSGVRCEDGHVAWLFLEDNQLSGPLPEGLDALSKLEGFELQNNQLNGTIPSDLGNLAKLESLYLYSNQLVGGIPPELGDLSNLEYLRLHDNELCGDIPVELMNLTNIVGLSLDNNHLTAYDPDLIAWLDQHNPGWDATQTDCPVGTTLQFSSATYSVDEDGKKVTITVTRVGGSQGAVSVNYATSGDTATAGSDYTEKSGTLSWSDGDTGDRTFNVKILNDDAYESDETVNLTLSNATGGATIGDPSTAVVTIIDDDEPGTLQFKKAKYEVNENGASVKITVTRVDGSDGAVSVDYNSSDGTATAGEDYIAIFGTLNWKDGNSTDKVITVAIINDTIYEGNETFNLTLTNATGGADIGEPGTAVVTIVDNDKKAGTLQFSSATYRVDEDGVSVEITVTRVGGSDGAVSVDYSSSDGTATAGDDYTAIFGTLNWKDGNSTDKVITVAIINDTIYEGNETFNLTLTNATGGATIGDPDTAKVTITDNDTTKKHGILQFSKTEFTIKEKPATNAIITIKRIEGSDGDILVEYATSDDTAKADSDYAETRGSRRWEDGDDDDKTFTVLIRDDDEPENKETFIVSLANPRGGAQLGTPDTATVTIKDDDSDYNCKKVTGISKKECQALIELYNSTDGENWTNNTGWKATNSPCSSWNGVNCQGEFVTGLALGNNNLKGSISKKLSKLKQLKILWLNNNKLSGNIPSSLMKLDKLTYLNLNDNCLKLRVSPKLGEWLDDLNPGWDETQGTDCLY
jgi:Leucine-rich repeat (LRR) protein